MKKNNTPLVSIITPVYNGEKYISECIQSVLEQTYQNWEYVIVNNCSTDKTLEIASYFANSHRRIRIHNNFKHLPMIQNWNYAVRQVSPESKYCKEVHADDTLLPRCVEEMVRVAESHPTVGIVGSYNLRGDKVGCNGLTYPQNVFSGKTVCRAMLKKEYFVFGSPTSLLIRSDIIQNRNPFYDDTFFHADTEFCYTILQNCDFGFVHQVLSYTRLHDDSQTETYGDKYSVSSFEYLGMLKKHGPIYFEHTEFESLLKARTKKYYRYLASKLFQSNRKGLWRVHRSGLQRVGLAPNTRQLIVAVLLEGIDRFLNPKRTLNNMVRGSSDESSTRITRHHLP